MTDMTLATEALTTKIMQARDDARRCREMAAQHRLEADESMRLASMYSSLDYIASAERWEETAERWDDLAEADDARALQLSKTRNRMLFDACSTPLSECA
jgi:hypothetical protein